MKIAILGGGGFIGSAICDRLLADGHCLRIFERPRIAPYRMFSVDEHVEWVAGDFSNDRDIEVCIDGVDIVIHLISSTLPSGSNENIVFDVQSNVISTLQLLNLMVAKGVKKIIFISSGGTVYGNPIYTPIDEGHPTNPMVSYGITKLTIEKYLLLFQSLYGMKSIILRVANPYGERQRFDVAQGAIGVFLRKALRREPIEIWGNGEVIRDYVYVDDVADAFARAINYDGGKSVFNIGCGAGQSLNEVLAVIKEIFGRDLDVRYQPSRSFDIPISILDNSLALNELGWVPKVKFFDGVKKTAAWMSDDLNKISYD